MPKFEIKNYKECMGREGYAYSCTLYMGDPKVRVCLVNQLGDGGEIRMEWLPGCATFKQEWDAYVANLPEDEGLQPDDGMAIATIIDEWETEKKLKKWCKKWTVFLLKDEEGIRTLNVPYSLVIGDNLRKKYGDKLEKIYNECQ